MKFFRKHKNILVGMALLCTVIGSSALTLGRARGAVLLGQPLDITVPVQLAADEEPLGQCFDADVFHGDTKLDASRVRVKLEAGPQAQAGTLRISSSANVDEPVVTVYLRAGCSQKTSRRFVLLADLASDITPASTANTANVTLPGFVSGPASGSSSGMAASDGSPVPSVVRLPGSNPALTKALRSSGNNAKNSAKNSVGSDAEGGMAKAVPASAAVAAQKSLVRKPKAQPPEVAGRSHLKLDLTDPAADSVVALRLSSELSGAPGGNEKLRAEAIALWRAINAKPEDILRDSSRVEALEGDVKALRSLSGKNQESVADLRMRLQKAEAARFSNWLVYALLAFLVLAIAAAAYFWNRQRTLFSAGGDWWSSPNSTTTATDSLGRGAGRAEARRPGESVFDATGAQSLTALGSSHAPLTEVDIDLDVNESLFESLKNARVLPHQVAHNVVASDNAVTQMPAPTGEAFGARLVSPPVSASVAPPVPHPPGADAHGMSHSMAATLRAINTEELFDIRQQADFFLALGQYDQAIQVLQTRVEEHGESSPLVYLDLLKIFHKLGRKLEYQQYRKDFNRSFKGLVPQFTAFGDEGKALEGYPALLERITALWPMAPVLDVIEDCIFRNEGDDMSSSYDLAALRDLLMLHAIAKRMVGRTAGPLDSQPAPLTRDPAKNYADFAAQATLPTTPVPLVSSTAVDFDLDLLAAPDIKLDSKPDTKPGISSGGISFLAPSVPQVDHGNLIDFEIPDQKQPPK